MTKEALDEPLSWYLAEHLAGRVSVGRLAEAIGCSIENADVIAGAFDRLKAELADGAKVHEEVRRAWGAALDERRTFQVERDAARGEAERTRAALGRIALWFGEFPATGELHSDGTPKSYGYCFGSNGERDYMRAIARAALQPAPMQDAACRGCGKMLQPKNLWIADGCECNSRRGINHGLVAKDVCTCDECDPGQTGSSRWRRPQATEPKGTP